VCRYVSRENYVCRIKSVPKFVGVLISIKFIYFCEQSWCQIMSSQSLLRKVGVEYLKFKYPTFSFHSFLSPNYYRPYYYKPKKCFTFFYTPYFFTLLLFPSQQKIITSQQPDVVVVVGRSGSKNREFRCYGVISASASQSKRKFLPKTIM
jgi:hypothetical protein